jgi:hypothetical protein
VVKIEYDLRFEAPPPLLSGKRKYARMSREEYRTEYAKLAADRADRNRKRYRWEELDALLATGPIGWWVRFATCDLLSGDASNIAGTAKRRRGCRFEVCVRLVEERRQAVFVRLRPAFSQGAPSGLDAE